jgi:hypothetical protein
MKFNWKFFCGGGIVWSALLGGLDYWQGNMLGAKLQLILGLAYSAGLVYLSLKEKKND